MSTMSMQPHLTFEEFLEIERESEFKHELIGGLVHNMAPSSDPEPSQQTSCSDCNGERRPVPPNS